MLPRLRDDATALLRRDAAPDVECRQRDPDGAHPAHEGDARHARILVRLLAALVFLVALARRLGSAVRPFRLRALLGLRLLRSVTARARLRPLLSFRFLWLPRPFGALARLPCLLCLRLLWLVAPPRLRRAHAECGQRLIVGRARQGREHAARRALRSGLRTRRRRDVSDRRGGKRRRLSLAAAADAPAPEEAGPLRRRQARGDEEERAAASRVAWGSRLGPARQAKPPPRFRARIQRPDVRRSASRSTPFAPTSVL